MKIAQWRLYCWNALEAAGVNIETFPSGAMRIRSGGVDAMTSDIGTLSRQELEKLTRGRASTPFNATGYAVANTQAL